MGIEIKPSDLYYRYPRKKETRELPKFTGLPDPHPFDRNDLYEVIPMFEAVMNELGSVDGVVLQRIETMLNDYVPLFIRSREEIYRCLVEMMRDELGFPPR
jgi:hypothetical protein